MGKVVWRNLKDSSCKIQELFYSPEFLSGSVGFDKYLIFYPSNASVYPCAPRNMSEELIFLHVFKTESKNRFFISQATRSTDIYMATSTKAYT